MAREPKRVGALGTTIVILLILAMLAATGYIVWLCIDLTNQKPELPTIDNVSVVLPTEDATVPAETTEAAAETTVPTTEPPKPEQVVATATISSQGDLLMHSPVFASAKQSDGSYDFESIFRYTTDILGSMDYAVANLETTFGGPSHPHQPNMSFSCPDELATSAAAAGYDMFVTANNHSGDSMGDGVIRTLEISRAAGLDTLGSQMPEEKPYSIIEINGIKIGMVAYTWAFSGDGSKFSLNGLSAIKDEGQMNYFTKKNPDKLYKELEPMLEEMKAEGAEATVLFIHWGEEYELKENAAQQKMAQKICDLGVDVIIGGHAHVVQPMALLESTVDPNHKTICIYSQGNAVSNQRTGVSTQFPTGYTEDGVIFTVTFEKYSDGNVFVSATDVIPTWVNMHSNNGTREYNILPLILEQEGTWEETFGLTGNQLSAAQRSYDRTMGIVGEGLEACQTWLEEYKADIEEYYYNLAFFPEKFAAEETIPETILKTTLETESAA